MILDGERYLLAVDPGNSSGWAVFGPNGEPMGMGIARGREAMLDLLHEVGKVEIVVIEDYRLFQKKALAQSGSTMETTRVIGAIEYWATAVAKAKTVLQPSSILPIAYKWSGVLQKGKHDDQHNIVAFNHGYYYLQKNGIIKPQRRPV